MINENSNTIRIAYLFPGQGTQQIGMGYEIYKKYRKAKQVFENANDILQFNLSGLCFNGPLETLTRTEYLQPALLTVSTAYEAILAEHNIKAVIACGHSLGEYSALVAAGALSFEQGLQLVRKRAQLMQECVPNEKGWMIVIIGLDENQILNLTGTILSLGKYITIAGIMHQKSILLPGIEMQ